MYLGWVCSNLGHRKSSRWVSKISRSLWRSKWFWQHNRDRNCRIIATSWLSTNRPMKIYLYSIKVFMNFSKFSRTSNLKKKFCQKFLHAYLQKSSFTINWHFFHFIFQISADTDTDTDMSDSDSSSDESSGDGIEIMISNLEPSDYDGHLKIITKCKKEGELEFLRIWFY